MPHLSIASGEKIMKESESSAWETKVHNTIALLQESDKLSTFFTRLFQRQEMRFPSPDQSLYLHSLLDELLETLPGTDPGKIDLAVFKILLRYNFNHESVVKYYSAEIDHLILNSPEKERDVLEDIMKYCARLDRKDKAYNTAGHTLRKEVSHLVEQQLKEISTFEPFRILLSANVFFPFMRLLKDEKVYEEMKSSKERNSLRYAFRNKDGLIFSDNTVSNRIKLDDECNLSEVKKLLERMNKSLDDHILVKSRASRSKFQS